MGSLISDAASRQSHKVGSCRDVQCQQLVGPNLLGPWILSAADWPVAGLIGSATGQLSRCAVPAAGRAEPFGPLDPILSGADWPVAGLIGSATGIFCFHWISSFAAESSARVIC